MTTDVANLVVVLFTSRQPPKVDECFVRFFRLCRGLLHALVAVLFAAWTWGPITSKGSVCFSVRRRKQLLPGVSPLSDEFTDQKCLRGVSPLSGFGGRGTRAGKLSHCRVESPYEA